MSLWVRGTCHDLCRWCLCKTLTQQTPWDQSDCHLRTGGQEEECLLLKLVLILFPGREAVLPDLFPPRVSWHWFFTLCPHRLQTSPSHVAREGTMGPILSLLHLSSLDIHLCIQTKQDQLHNTLHKHRHPFVLRENKSCNGKSVDFGARHTWSESHFLVMQP